MDKYIMFHMVDAEPLNDYNGMPGYEVVRKSGNSTWCDKDEFDKAYMKIGSNNTITPENVRSFVHEVQVSTIGEKTTMVRAILVNGFELIETSSCVDVANYDEDMGAAICLKKIEDKIWFLLGFLLQTAQNGIK